jgi:transcriptional regulator with XRE-family HTH domain
MHFSQAVLADRLGISKSNLLRIEHSQVIPSIATALRLAKILNTPVDELFTLEETKILTKEEKFDLYLEDLLKKL